MLNGTFNYLDLTALGRQEPWEKPSGRSWLPASGWWWRRHDEYGEADLPADDESATLTDYTDRRAARRWTLFSDFFVDRGSRTKFCQSVLLDSNA